MVKSFKRVRGARIHAQCLKPKNILEKHPAIIMFHGYRGNCGDWVEKLAYVAMGYTVVAMDCRGQGGGLTIACAALEPKIKMIAPVYPFLSDYKRVWQIKNLAKHIRCQVMFTATLLDNICPPSTQFAVYNKITSKKFLRVYNDFGHENLPKTNDAIFQFMSNL